MKTILEIPTRGDSMTQPGGIALRYREETNEFIVHNFNTDRETGTEREYFGGGYYTHDAPNVCFAAALEDFSKRVQHASGYDLGGSIDLEKLLG